MTDTRTRILALRQWGKDNDIHVTVDGPHWMNEHRVCFYRPIHSYELGHLIAEVWTLTLAESFVSLLAQEAPDAE